MVVTIIVRGKWMVFVAIVDLCLPLRPEQKRSNERGKEQKTKRKRAKTVECF